MHVCCNSITELIQSYHGGSQLALILILYNKIRGDESVNEMNFGIQFEQVGCYGPCTVKPNGDEAIKLHSNDI